jgi:hypothetical protein
MDGYTYFVVVSTYPPTFLLVHAFSIACYKAIFVKTTAQKDEEAF